MWHRDFLNFCIKCACRWFWSTEILSHCFVALQWCV